MNHHERISALQDMVWGDRGTGKTDSRDENTKENNMNTKKDTERFVRPNDIAEKKYVASLGGGKTMLIYENGEAAGTSRQLDRASVMTKNKWLETIFPNSPHDLNHITLAEVEEVSIVRFK